MNKSLQALNYTWEKDDDLSQIDEKLYNCLKNFLMFYHAASLIFTGLPKILSNRTLQ